MSSTRLIDLSDAPALTALLHRNREFLAPWDPIRPEAYFTLAGQRWVIEDVLAQHAAGLLVPHVILRDGEVAGRVTLSNIVRGPLLSGNLGYWVGAEHTRRGLATAAVADIVDIAFTEMALHRVEAGTLRHNTGSQTVLERNGFERYGIAPRYLRIAGRWQDHVMYQVLNPAVE